MSNEQKIRALMELIFKRTEPKDQLGFYTEQDLYNDIKHIINYEPRD